MPEIIVIGSANVDLLIPVKHQPRPGETILAQGLKRQSGGKGANQAVAAARLGSVTRFIGCVGDDHEGTMILNSLRSEGVNISCIDILSGVPSGIAIVTVDENAENSITVVPGANSKLQASRVANHVQKYLDRDPIILMQAEIPHEVHGEVIKQVSAHQAVRFVLNLAPYMEIKPEILERCDPIVLNETEAEELCGSSVADIDSAKSAARRLSERCRSVVITLGSLGAVWAERGGDFGYVPAPAVESVVDSTGAGDAFVGAMVAALALGESLGDGVEDGVTAGSFSVTKFGAQTSYPTAEELAKIS